ncbi:MAG: hypothetical protein CMJ83_17810 [Planctomycetes bacterium]|nr:hypothetical protein [Planctomycetota bacterium]
MSRVAITLILIPTLCLAGAGVIFFTSTFPSLSRSSEIEEEIADAQKKAEEGLLDAADVDQFMSGELRAIKHAMQYVDDHIPSETRPADFFPAFAMLAVKAGVTFTSLAVPGDAEAEEEEIQETETPPDEPTEQAVELQPLFATLPFIINVEGPPERIIDFLGLLHASHFPIAITQVEMARHDKKFLLSTAEIRADVIIRTGEI